MSSFEYELQLRVRYAETDQMGIVWHGNYLLYFEAARTEALRAAGLSYRALEASGLMLPVVETALAYFKPAAYDDLLTVRVTVPERPGVRIRFEYEIVDAAGVRIVTGHTTLACVDAATRRPCRPPPSLLAHFTDKREKDV
jgi:acyl-CoA thioester hydrolase